jgi:tRNA (guanine37-N1)-methyltransferase
MIFTVVTLFPELFPGTLGVSLPKQSLEEQWQLNVINLRDYGMGKHSDVDDEVYGGGSGMLIRADVLGNAIDDILAHNSNQPIIYTSPRGVLYNQKYATSYANEAKDMIIICGRFEGIDYRVIEYYNILEMSIGNFVLFGGELAAMCIMESIIRLLPGVCGNEASVHEESFAVNTEFENLMEYPHYTRPSTWKGLTVPDVLVSGHHKNIEEWRLQQAKEMTQKYKNI